MADPNSYEVLAQFNQLIEELIGRNLHRSTYRPWEIGILVDMVECSQRGVSTHEKILRDYQKAVQEHMQAGAPSPLKLSEYLESLEVRDSPAGEQSTASAQGN
jgi:hypothetical protein